MEAKNKMTDRADFKKYLMLRSLHDKTIRTVLIIYDNWQNTGHDSETFLLSKRHLKVGTVNMVKYMFRNYFQFTNTPYDKHIYKSLPQNSRHGTIVPYDAIQDFIKVHKVHHRTGASQLMRWRDYTMLRLFVYGGPRSTEVGNILPRDVDLSRSRIYIDTLKRGVPGYLYMDSETAYYLRRYMELGNFNPTDKLFNLKEGRIRTIIQGMTGYNPRDFRATFLTEIAIKTKNPYLVMKRARHKSISTSMNYVQLAMDYEQDLEVELFV